MQSESEYHPQLPVTALLALVFVAPFFQELFEGHTDHVRTRWDIGKGLAQFRPALVDPGQRCIVQPDIDLPLLSLGVLQGPSSRL